MAISAQSACVGAALWRRMSGITFARGGHAIEMFDWLQFLQFADYHLKP